MAALPQKKYYRQRAHSNPMADHTFDYPVCPEDMDWSLHYPAIYNSSIESENGQKSPDNDNDRPRVEFADIGCGYGGLLVQLSPLFPKTLLLGMEIRVKVSDYVNDRILALRQSHPGQYQNVSVIRTNAMKYLPNFFRKGQLTKMFFLFPDPHFKQKKHKWRIIRWLCFFGDGSKIEIHCTHIMYIYHDEGLMFELGFAYTITDVPELYDWMKKHFIEHPLFEEVSEQELERDIVVSKLYDSTEEGKKVTRNTGIKLVGVYRRIADPTIT